MLPSVYCALWRVLVLLRKRKGGESMSILFALVGTPLASFAEGAILAASVYLVSRGVKNPLKNKK